jgi:hypothetical protein
MGNITHSTIRATKYEVDHIKDLAPHWTTAGSTGVDGPRWALSNNSGNLRYITMLENQRRPKGSYANYVGKGFTSTYADGGANNAKRIDGQPLLDAPGGKPI